jgi:hypothetical protein
MSNRESLECQFLAGYHGKDSMRENAKKMLAGELKTSLKTPRSASAKGKEKPRRYAEGGYVDDDSVPQYGYPPQTLKRGGRARVQHKSIGGILRKGRDWFKNAYKKGQDAYGQVKEYIPAVKKYGKMAVDELGNRSDKFKQMSDRASGMYDNAVNTAKKYAPKVEQFATDFSPEAGKQVKEYREGLGLKRGGRARGNVYEREMVGERPSRKKHHFNYQDEMRGEHPSKRKHFAIGGSGKIRHQEMTKGGKPIKSRRNVGR